MVAIWFNVVVFLLYCQIAASASRSCSDPNEEFNDRGCETKCEIGISPCKDCYDNKSEQELTSGCFCKEGTYRDSVSNKCVNQSECTKKLCGDNQTFTEYFLGEKICPDDGFVMAYTAIECTTSCKCNEGFIRSCTEVGKCITDSECETRKTTPSSC